MGPFLSYINFKLVHRERNIVNQLNNAIVGRKEDGSTFESYLYLLKSPKNVKGAKSKYEKLNEILI